tara:strand:+ start:7720 stop:8976 length:1257 start_codon:yes stop_codon:yes gene_type:complete
MYNWCKDLFPICRSITGDGLKKTLSYFEKINPSLKRLKFKSGKRVFDWTIPLEWKIKDAYIEHTSGKRFAEFKKNNLHLVNFSMPTKLKLDKKNLLKKIHSHPKYKDAIPYVTSYYKKDWGFCLSENDKKKLPEGKYKVFINSKFIKGNLDISHAILKGKYKKEIFFSSYVCHPSMANNELSGPVVLNGLIKYIKKTYKTANFTYRFVLLPETIGSIAYLSRYKDILKKNMIMGFNLSCLGDNRAYSIIKGPDGKNLSFYALNALLRKKKNYKIYDFTERGSDERQYCAPGIDLPVIGFCRSKYGKYKEYHTSKDDLNIISDKSLNQSLDILKKLVDICELSLFPKTRILCEPNLSKRNLYPTTSKHNTMSKKLKLRKDIIAFANGKRSIFEIADILSISIEEVVKEIKILKISSILS